MRSFISSFRRRLFSVSLLFLVNRRLHNIVSAQTACADCAACLAASITQVLISSNVNTADFQQCTTIEEVTFANTVTIIPDNSFRDASSLTKINFLDTFSSGLTIGNSAFFNTALTGALVLPAGLTSIGDQAFQIVQFITSVNIPDSVTSIGNAAFSQATALATVTFAETVGALTIGNGAFYSTALTGALVLPAGLTSIGYSAFMLVSTLTSVTIPHSVTFIYDLAFHEATALTTVTFSGTFSSGLTIGYNAFYGTALTGSLVLPDGLTIIGYSAFEAVKLLTSVTIPDSVILIDDTAFYLSGLTSVTFQGTFSGLTMGYNAFSNTSLTGPLTLPAGLTSIGDEAFAGLTLLTDVTIPDSLITIGNSSFLGSGPSAGSCLIWDSSITRSIGTNAFVPNYIEDCSPTVVPSAIPTVVPSDVPTVVPTSAIVPVDEAAEDSGLTTGALVGIIVAGVVVAILLILVCAWFVFKRQRNHSTVIVTHHNSTNNKNNNNIVTPVAEYELVKGGNTVMEV